MKPFLLILTSVALSATSFAQSHSQSAEKKNEIGLTFVSLKVDYYGGYSVSPYFHLMDGITYKRHFGNNAIRFGFFYDESSDYNRGTFPSSDSFNETKVNIGFQRTFINKLLRPYFAIDVLYLYAESQHEHTTDFPSTRTLETLKHTGIGLAPFIGLKIQLLKSLSFTAETGHEFLYKHKKGNKIVSESAYSDYRQSFSVKDGEVVRIIEPLRMSINISF